MRVWPWSLAVWLMIAVCIGNTNAMISAAENNVAADKKWFD